jgi:DNA-binding NarL/FixJ family response regulator
MLGYLPWLDVAILDMTMPEHHRPGAKKVTDMGMQLTHRIKTERPEAGVVLLSAYDDHAQAVLNLLQQGHQGIAYLLKGIEPERVLQAVDITRTGGVLLDSDLLLDETITLNEAWLKHSVTLMDSLTSREATVAELTVAGFSAKVTADKLTLSPKTVENNLATIYRKLGLADLPYQRKAVLLARVYTAYTQHKTKLG